MLDKPPITEKLTNAWHLLNIHYSDNSSEFQRAERMLNQHSYSQSEPPHHIAARLSADENGTLGPDSKKTFRDSSLGISVSGVCVCVCKWVVMLVFTPQPWLALNFSRNFPKIEASAPCFLRLSFVLFLSPHLPTPAPRLWQPYEEWAELTSWRVGDHYNQIHS